TSQARCRSTSAPKANSSPARSRARSASSSWAWRASRTACISAPNPCAPSDPDNFRQTSRRRAAQKYFLPQRRRGPQENTLVGPFRHQPTHRPPSSPAAPHPEFPQARQGVPMSLTRSVRRRRPLAAVVVGLCVVAGSLGTAALADSGTSSGARAPVDANVLQAAANLDAAIDSAAQAIARSAATAIPSKTPLRTTAAATKAFTNEVD